MLSKLVTVSKYFKVDRLTTIPFYNFGSKIENLNLEINKEEFKTNESKRSRFSNWTGQNRYKIGLLFLGLTGIGMFGYSLVIYGPPPKNDEGTYIDDDYSSLNPLLAYPCRAIQNFREFNQTIQDPISDKLLPDPIPIHHPMTLVIECNDVLLHPEWTYKSGWKFKKRPGLDVFLRAVSQHFEVVIFTSDSAMNLHPILHQLDPNFEKMHYRLFREATRYRRGVHIKDLSTLNRDLNKVVRIDWEKKACSMQPENTLLIKRWTGDMADRELIDLASFLMMIQENKLSNVREGLEYYAKFDNPLQEFRRRCEKLQEYMTHKKVDTELQKKKSSINDVVKNLRRS